MREAEPVSGVDTAVVTEAGVGEAGSGVNVCVGICVGGMGVNVGTSVTINPEG